jgi:glycine/D-amino acid oxidase-like deaminating enzyme
VAYWLARDGCDVVLVESAHLAAGSTGRNAGLMLHGVSEVEDPRLLREVQCLEDMRDDYDVTGHLSLASSQSVWDAFNAEVACRPAWAPPLFALERRACEDVLHTRVDDRYPGGRWYPGGAVVHPVRYVCELARAATRHGARIHTGTTVTNVGRDGGTLVVHTTRGLVATSAVVHATAASIRLLPEFATIVRPIRVQVLATDPLPRRFSVGIGVNWGDVFGRQLSDGRFVIGGGGGASIAAHLDRADDIDEDVQLRLSEFLPQTFPEFPPVSLQQSWTGVLDCTPDGKPLVGPHPCAAGQWICCGFNGHGLPNAIGVGQTLTRAVRGSAPTSSLQAWAPSRFFDASAWERRTHDAKRFFVRE